MLGLSIGGCPSKLPRPSGSDLLLAPCKCYVLAHVVHREPCCAMAQPQLLHDERFISPGLDDTFHILSIISYILTRVRFHYGV